jgi:hypothetical protein
MSTSEHRRHSGESGLAATSTLGALTHRTVLKVKTERRLTFVPYSDNTAKTSAKPIFLSPPYRASQPNKLQKQRKGAAPSYHQAPRRPVSFDISTLSDTSTRALIDGRISIARYGQYTTPFIHRAVLKKNRDSRAVTAHHHRIHTPSTRRSPGDPPRPYSQASRLHLTREDQRPLDQQWHTSPERRHASVPTEELSSLLNNISHKSSSLMSASWPQLPNGDQYSNNASRPPSSLEVPMQLHDHIPNNQQQRHSVLPVFPRLDLDKPLPPKPSALVEEFSPTSLHRRWTITSHPSTHEYPQNDILLDDLGLSRNQAPSSFSSISVPPASMAPLESVNQEEVREPSPEASPVLQGLTGNFIETQRSYVSILRKTVLNDPDTPPVDLLLSFLSVIEVSEEFLRGMQLDPSPLGIANAFLHTCGKLENHLLQWSKEVNKFVLESTQSAQIQASVRPDRRYRHSVFPTRRKGIHLATTRNQKKESFLASFFRRKMPPQGRDSGTAVTPDTLWQRSSRGPGIWEMAVLPTQRTMRYAFLFKGKRSM